MQKHHILHHWCQDCYLTSLAFLEVCQTDVEAGGEKLSSKHMMMFYDQHNFSTDTKAGLKVFAI